MDITFFSDLLQIAMCLANKYCDDTVSRHYCIALYCVVVFHELLREHAIHQFVAAIAPDSPRQHDLALPECTEEPSELEKSVKKAEQIR